MEQYLNQYSNRQLNYNQIELSPEGATVLRVIEGILQNMDISLNEETNRIKGILQQASNDTRNEIAPYITNEMMPPQYPL